jgi:hypothetical protein
MKLQKVHILAKLGDLKGIAIPPLVAGAEVHRRRKYVVFWAGKVRGLYQAFLFGKLKPQAFLSANARYLAVNPYNGISLRL